MPCVPVTGDMAVTADSAAVEAAEAAGDTAEAVVALGDFCCPISPLGVSPAGLHTAIFCKIKENGGV